MEIIGQEDDFDKLAREQQLAEELRDRVAEHVETDGGVISIGREMALEIANTLDRYFATKASLAALEEASAGLRMELFRAVTEIDRLQHGDIAPDHPDPPVAGPENVEEVGVADVVDIHHLQPRVERAPGFSNIRPVPDE